MSPAWLLLLALVLQLLFPLLLLPPLVLQLLHPRLPMLLLPFLGVRWLLLLLLLHPLLLLLLLPLLGALRLEQQDPLLAVSSGCEWTRACDSICSACRQNSGESCNNSRVRRFLHARYFCCCCYLSLSHLFSCSPCPPF